LPKIIQDEFRLKEVIFREDLSDPRLGTHKLKGKNEWSFIITYKSAWFLFLRRSIYSLLILEIILFTEDSNFICQNLLHNL